MDGLSAYHGKPFLHLCSVSIYVANATCYSKSQGASRASQNTSSPSCLNSHSTRPPARRQKPSKPFSPKSHPSACLGAGTSIARLASDTRLRMYGLDMQGGSSSSSGSGSGSEKVTLLLHCNLRIRRRRWDSVSVCACWLRRILRSRCAG